MKNTYCKTYFQKWPLWYVYTIRINIFLIKHVFGRCPLNYSSEFISLYIDALQLLKYQFEGFDHELIYQGIILWPKL